MPGDGDSSRERVALALPGLPVLIGVAVTASVGRERAARLRAAVLADRRRATTLTQPDREKPGAK